MPHHPTPRRSFLFALACLAIGPSVSADDPPKPGGHHEYDPLVVAASPDAAKAMKSFQVPKGLSLDLWAAEPLLANPVVFGFDAKGKVYVVETFRLHHGVTDTRGHMNWLDDDLASRTVEDRVAKYKKFLGKDFATYGIDHDRIRLVEDRDGDGKADHASVFADGFNKIPDGLAAGVLVRKGDVYFTCIPDLWLLRDTDGDGKADTQKSLGYGYGVHTGFLGHDLHGLIFGPDGKLYFSIGDRGLNVKTVDRTVFLPDAGAVLRCNADGTELELFATGLRNPQELAFDDHGNLFTVDNNSDSGDKARLVYLIEGSDSGWTMGWQYIEQPNSRGPWNAEKLWYPKFPGQAADIVPPVVNISDGPSGLVYDPGVTLLPEKYRRHFFLADFRGGSSGSGIRAFSVKPDGAGFALDDSEQMLWGVLATDVDFGPDGALYVSDWVEGWNTTGKGRIYKLHDPKAPDASKAAEVKSLLADGFDKTPIDTLATLLGHADRRVRQEAQFALADHGLDSVPALEKVARSGPGTLARLHAVWGLGQVGRKAPGALKTLPALLKDRDIEVRANTAKTLGDLGVKSASASVATLLADPSARVRSLAAIAYGKLAKADTLKPLLEILRQNADADPVLRHSAVIGLTEIGDPQALVAAASDSSRSVRLGVLLALRRLKSPEIARFLDDADAGIVTEAARGIYDAPIVAALPKLAALVSRSGLSEPAVRRVINAVARLGTPESATALAKFATRDDVPEAVRVEAIRLLSDWSNPSGRDPVTGLWRPRDSRPADEAADAFIAVAEGLFRSPSHPISLAALHAAGPVPIAGAIPALRALVADQKMPAASRAEALRALDRLGDPRLIESVSIVLHDSQKATRIEGQRLLAKLKPSEALPVLSKVLETGATAEKQAAFATLGAMEAHEVDDVLALWLDRDAKGQLPAEVELDLLDAARARKSDKLAAKLTAIDSARSKDDPLASYRESLVGGSAERGEKVLLEKAEVQCVRCHKVNGKGGEVGPELTGVGKRQDRRYLLESIVLPNKQIAKGFETLLVSTSDGQVKSGILKEDTGKELRLITAEGKPLVIPKADIEEQKRGASAMPEDLLKNLSKSEIRDLVEYLSTSK